MIIFGSSTEVSAANLNSLHAADAVVDASASSTTGSVYRTITDAISAGKKAIVVMPGSYSGLTISTAGITITGVNRPRISGTTIVSGSAEFNSTITIAASDVHLRWLASDNPSGNSFVVNGGTNHSSIYQCGIASPSQTGIHVKGALEDVTIAENHLADCSNGILVECFSTSMDMKGIRILNNWVYDSDGNGIAVMNYTTSDTSDRRNTLLFGNYLNGNAQSWGHGIRVEADAGATIMANTILGSGATSNTDGHGIYITAPGTTPYTRTTVIGNTIMGNYAYGIALSETSSRVPLVGNIVLDNGAGELSNCSSCPGVATLSSTNVTS